MNDWREKEIVELIEAMAACEGPEGVCEIFDVTLTAREINDMPRRFKIRKLLEDGKSYSEIQTVLGVSSEMVSRVSSNSGYGFRRAYSLPEKSAGSQNGKKYKRRPLRYKGAPTLTEIFFPKD